MATVLLYKTEAPYTACTCGNSQTMMPREQQVGRSPAHTPACSLLCRGQAQGCSSSLALTHCLDSPGSPGWFLLFLCLFFLSWGLSRGGVLFWIKFPFHIYSEVWKESRKHQKSKFHLLELFWKEGSPTLSRLQERASLYSSGGGGLSTEHNSVAEWETQRKRREWQGTLVSQAYVSHRFTLTPWLPDLLKGSSFLAQPTSLYPPTFLHSSE